MAFIWCGLVVFLPLVVPIGAVVFQVSVRLANRVLGRPPADHRHGYEPDDYVLPSARAAVIPEPGFGRAAWITAAVFLAYIAAVVALSILERNSGLDRDEARVVFGGLSLATAFLIQSGVLALLLPTTYPRACLVAAFALLLSVPVVLVVGGLALVGLNAVAPNMGG